MKYRFFDEMTSDIIFEAYGSDLKSVFENAGEALFKIICDVDNVKFVETRTVELNAGSVSALMVAWLQALIAEVDISEMFFSGFNIVEIDDTHLKAVISGESITPEKGKTIVKAVTYHQFEFKQTDEGFLCRVSVDI